MSIKNKRPGDALQRIPGAEKDSQLESTSLGPLYATPRDIQTRHLQRRCGVDKRTARLLAEFCFGEGR